MLARITSGCGCGFGPCRKHGPPLPTELARLTFKVRGCAVFTAGGGGAGGGGAGEELMCMRGVEGVVGQLESDMDHIAAFMVRHNLCSRCGPSSTMLALISSDCG